MYNEMSFLFNKTMVLNNINGNTNKIIDNTDTLWAENTTNKYVVYKDGEYFLSKGQTKNYIKDKIYDRETTDENPYITLLKDTGFNTKSKALLPSHFTYLRDLGVYPLNRLIILRRYSENAIVKNNLDEIKEQPYSTVIGWLPEDADFFNISFNEDWTTTDKYLHEIIFDIMENEFKIGGSEKLIPAPGWTQGLLFNFLNKMGLTNADGSDIPFGDPNLLREAAYRDYNKQSLMSNFSFEFTTTYEQKYVNNIDPASAMLDIIRNILYMGTSDTVFIFKDPDKSKIMQKLKAATEGKGNNVKLWSEFVKETITQFVNALNETVTGLLGEIAKTKTGEIDTEKLKTENEKRLEIAQKKDKDRAALYSKIVIKSENGIRYYKDDATTEDIAKLKSYDTDKDILWLRNTDTQNKNIEETSKKNDKLKFNIEVQEKTKVINSLMDETTVMGKFLKNVLAATFAKHRWPIRGSIGAMTGIPTAPWHLTIGNPYSPIISAGNMIVKSVTLSSKGEMGFNDMPLQVSATFKVEFSRNLGRQEIEELFNNGYKRIYNKQKNNN